MQTQQFDSVLEELSALECYDPFTNGAVLLVAGMKSPISSRILAESLRDGLDLGYFPYLGESSDSTIAREIAITCSLGNSSLIELEHPPTVRMHGMLRQLARERTLSVAVDDDSSDISVELLPTVRILVVASERLILSYLHRPSFINLFGKVVVF